MKESKQKNKAFGKTTQKNRISEESEECEPNQKVSENSYIMKEYRVS
jgi:hypothetical protein